MDNYTFGGYPIEVEVIGDDAILTCKGVIGKLSEIEAFLKKSNYPSNIYPFGDKCLIEAEDNDYVRIACLRESRAATKKMVEDCRMKLALKEKEEGIPLI